ncbi:MAG TPA: DUF4998 domain-containing protein [Sphingobacterium bovisgrunnientis]|jgi:hypothetical protein|nr:DUF4998 domain-containing protein [Sphingobacterium bovisgrunnientis]
MKKIFVTIIGCMFLSTFYNCAKNGDISKYIAAGETQYAAKPENLVALSGDNRIMLRWNILSDPNIVKARVYWRNKSDSVDVSISRKPGIDTIETVIPLAEGVYSFDVVHFHDNGVKSLSSNVSGRSYGDFYKSTLFNRIITNVAFTPSNQGVAITWGPSPNTSIGTQLYYITTAATGNLPRYPIALPTVSSSSYTRVENNINMEYRTMYKPDTAAIDTFYAPVQLIPIKY